MSHTTAGSVVTLFTPFYLIQVLVGWNRSFSLEPTFFYRCIGGGKDHNSSQCILKVLLYQSTFGWFHFLNEQQLKWGQLTTRWQEAHSHWRIEKRILGSQMWDLKPKFGCSLKWKTLKHMGSVDSQAQLKKSVWSPL